jgi:ABC-type uncharacterized transport system permease subunit
MNSYIETLRWLDVGANLIVISVCLWAVLDDKIRTRIVGTVALSFLAIAAAISLVPPDHITPIYRELQTWRHIALAWFCGWAYVTVRIGAKKRNRLQTGEVNK